MRKHLLGCCVVILVTGGAALAQPPAPKPGPEQKTMAFFAGTWSSSGDMKPGPFGPGGKTTGKDSCEWFSGGFQLVCRGEGTGPMGNMTSLGVMSYNAADKNFGYYVIDNFGSAELSTGTKSGNTWTFTADSQMSGQTFKSRYTIVETSPTSYTFKWESSPDGTKWSTMMEGKATKTSKGT